MEADILSHLAVRLRRDNDFGGQVVGGRRSYIQVDTKDAFYHDLRPPSSQTRTKNQYFGDINEQTAP